RREGPRYSGGCFFSACHVWNPVRGAESADRHGIFKAPSERTIAVKQAACLPVVGRLCLGEPSPFSPRSAESPRGLFLLAPARLQLQKKRMRRGQGARAEGTNMGIGWLIAGAALLTFLGLMLL